MYRAISDKDIPHHLKPGYLKIFLHDALYLFIRKKTPVHRFQVKVVVQKTRHTFATMLLSKGVPIESVSKMLGHTNIKTTQIYARITNKKIEQDMMQVADKFDGFRNYFIN